jgi:hypothetical protein
MLIQRIRIYEWRTAGSAEKLGPQGLRSGKAVGTDRDPGDFVKRLRADAALVRKDYVKKCRRNASDVSPERG